MDTSELMTYHRIVMESLQRIPFFKSLQPKTLEAISTKLRRVQLENGEVVFSEGSLGEAMYLIESGQVKVSVQTPAGQERVINYLGPGNFFGEMALLLDQRRSATVTVTIDAELWLLRKKDMDELLVDNPEIALQLTRELSRRLSDTFSETSQRLGYRLTAVFGDEAWRLAQSIRACTNQRVVLFDITGQELTQQSPADIQSEHLVILEAMEGASSEDLVETLGILADGYDWVLIGLSPEYGEVNAKALKIAQATVLLNTSARDWIIDGCPGPVFHCDGSQVQIDRTARKITHRSVGLALSSGGARGIAHIGVLETLEKANIPIDMIAGTSAGALFGGLYAAGKSIPEIADFARKLPHQISFTSGLWDLKLKLPWNGLIKGNATLKYLAKQFEQATFADTQIPFYVVAADVLTGEELTFESGSLAEAVRASIGMIGIFAPYQLNDHYLIDGGAVNPVPASVLAEKGANIIIASSVIPSIEEERARGQAAAKRQEIPNFFGVLTSMMAIMEREIVKTRMTPVDLLIRPKVEIFTAMDYEKADEFLQLGREAAENDIPLLKNLLEPIRPFE